MIEIVLDEKQHKKFTAEALKRMRMKGWDMQDLAEHIGKSVGSVRNFFSDNDNHSRFLAAEIADALGMRLKEKK